MGTPKPHKRKQTSETSSKDQIFPGSKVAKKGSRAVKQTEDNLSESQHAHGTATASNKAFVDQLFSTLKQKNDAAAKQDRHAAEAETDAARPAPVSASVVKVGSRSCR
jgi:Ulp1 family protease